MRGISWLSANRLASKKDFASWSKYESVCMWSGHSRFEHRVLAAQENGCFCFAINPFLEHVGLVCVCIEVVVVGGTLVHIWRYFVPYCHCVTVLLLFASVNDQVFVVRLQLVTESCRQVVFLRHYWSNKHNCNCTWSNTSSMSWVFMNRASQKIFRLLRSPIVWKLSRVFCHCCIYFRMHSAYIFCHKFAEEL
jgi:hypothetical protein